MKKTKVRDLMRTEVVTLQKGQSIPLAQELMRLLHIRNLPVIDENDKLVGLVTQPSLLSAQVDLLSNMAGAADPVDIEMSVPVAKVMTTDVPTVSPDTLAADALRLMLAAKEGSLPVIENDKLVGIVTGRDFLELALTDFDAAPVAAHTEVTQPARVAPLGQAPTPPLSSIASPAVAAPHLVAEASVNRWLTIGLVAIVLLLTLILVIKELGSSGESQVRSATPEATRAAPAASRAGETAAAPAGSRERDATSTTAAEATRRARPTPPRRESTAPAASDAPAAAEQPRPQPWVPEPLPSQR